MKYPIIKALALVITLPTLQVAANDDPAKLCQRAAELFKKNDLEGALEEARWCVTQLEQLKQNQISRFFHDQVLSFTGEPVSQQSAMGMTVVERRYVKGEQAIQVTLTGGATGGAMNAFSALAQFGMQAGMNKVRVQRRSGTITDEDGHIALMLSLKSGAVLNFESSDVDKETVMAFAEAFPIAELDDAIQ